MYDKGIIRLEHIFDFRSKVFYSFDQMQFLYTIPNSEFLKYAQLINCIPSEIKQSIKSEQMNTAYTNINLVELIKSKIKVNKILYNVQMIKNREVISSQEK